MKLYAICIDPRARGEMDEAKAWWMERRPSHADAIDAALEAGFRLLARFPELGHPILRDGAWSMNDRVYRLDEVRYFFAYRIEHERERIVITRFRHERRRPLRRL